MDEIELTEKDLKKLSLNTVYQIMEDSRYTRMTRVIAAIEFLHRIGA